MTSAHWKVILHRMGYYDDQAGIIRRYTDEEASWNNHLERSKNLVMKAVEMFNPMNIFVLGSGWLLDLPLQNMTTNKRTVTLVDLILPPVLHEKIDIYRHVTFNPADVTGGLINNVYKNTTRGFWRTKYDAKAVLDYKPYTLPTNADLVISLNILNQLDSLPVEYLKRKTRISAAQASSLRQHVQQQHIDLLKRTNSVLITDFCEHPLGKDDVEFTKPTIAAGLPEGIFREEWDWVFDTRKSYNTDTTTVFKVAGVILRG